MGLNAFKWQRALGGSAASATELGVRRERIGDKRLAAAFSVVFLVVVASPIVENWKVPARDDFPLSFYPMFSEERANTQRVNYLVGLNGRGERVLIPYQFAGPGGMNQVRRQMNKLVDRGDAARLCQTVATRVARAGSRLPDLRTIEVTTGTFRLSEYFTGRQIPVAEHLSARCTIERSRR
jgi:hypothetical protein